jgi:ATP-dependent DNA helicase PIF1
VGESDPWLLLLTKIAVGTLILYALARLYKFLGRYDRPAAKPLSSATQQETVNLQRGSSIAPSDALKTSPVSNTNGGAAPGVAPKAPPISKINAAPTDGIEITEEFSKALTLVQNGRQNLFVTGRAGTGKSTLLRVIKKAARGNVVVLAPTGLAAINVGGQTIHSFFKFPLTVIKAESIRPSRNAALFRNLDTLIIDEISMVRADLMEGIDRSLRVNRGRLHEPFGGVRVILIGDIHQLPPVVADSEVQQYLQDEFGGVYFFNAKVFHEWRPKYLELTKKFRQSDAAFGEILDLVADGAVAEEQLEAFNRNVISFEALPDRDRYTILAPHNQTVYDLNMRFLNALKGKEWTAEAVVSGKFDQSRYPTDHTLRLKVGAKVVLLRNDPQKRWVNGTSAVVAKLNQGRVWINVKGREFELERHVWERIKYEYDAQKRRIVENVIGSFKQFPIRLAWALTIHKSQGMTLENVYLDLAAGAFAHGQTYVALSRCRSIKALALARPLRQNDIIVDPSALAYRHAFESL